MSFTKWLATLTSWLTGKQIESARERFRVGFLHRFGPSMFVSLKHLSTEVELAGQTHPWRRHNLINVVAWSKYPRYLYRKKQQLNVEKQALKALAAYSGMPNSIFSFIKWLPIDDHVLKKAYGPSNIRFYSRICMYLYIRKLRSRKRRKPYIKPTQSFLCALDGKATGE